MTSCVYLTSFNEFQREAKINQDLQEYGEDIVAGYVWKIKGVLQLCPMVAMLLSLRGFGSYVRLCGE